MSQRPMCLTDAARYVLDRSWIARRNERWSHRLAVLAADELADGGDEESARTRCRDTVRREVGNPVVVFILLNVVLPIVVKLVIEWWTNRKERD